MDPSLPWPPGGEFLDAADSDAAAATAAIVQISTGMMQWELVHAAGSAGEGAICSRGGGGGTPSRDICTAVW